MANVERRAQFHNAAVTLEGGREELLEVRIRHAVTLDRQMILGIAFVVHVVWQIREDQISGSAVHQPRDISLVRSVAHQESVWPKRPQIARNADGRLGDVGNIVFVGQARGRFFRRQKPRQLFIVEATRLKSNSASPRACNSMRRLSSSHDAPLIANWLSAITKARRCASERCLSTITGTSVMPFWRAAATLA